MSNVKVPLSINSRFIDIQEHWNESPERPTDLKRGWLVTNTRFSLDAIAYAKCVGLHLLWDYPLGNGIKQNKNSLWPVNPVLGKGSYAMNGNRKQAEQDEISTIAGLRS